MQTSHASMSSTYLEEHQTSTGHHLTSTAGCCSRHNSKYALIDRSLVTTGSILSSIGEKSRVQVSRCVPVDWWGHTAHTYCTHILHTHTAHTHTHTHAPPPSSARRHPTATAAVSLGHHHLTVCAICSCNVLAMCVQCVCATCVCNSFHLYNCTHWDFAVKFVEGVSCGKPDHHVYHVWLARPTSTLTPTRAREGH